jgi:acyl carrier protein
MNPTTTSTTEILSISTAPDKVLQKFSAIVAKSLHIDAATVVPDAYLDELGAESLDLIEISMEVESQFNIWMAEKSILDTAREVFGTGVLEKDGYLTEAGKALMRRRMPESAASTLTGEVAVKDLTRYFMKVSTWTYVIQSLMEQTPKECAQCGGALQNSSTLKMKCESCGLEISLRSGEELNRDWVREYYKEVYGGEHQEVTRAESVGQ